MVNVVKTRFCPSPTGFVHLGNARTALFNALLARKEHGVFLLRIEDTDIKRSQEEYVIALKQDLLWLNLTWQEGPSHDLGQGPYFQSKRQHIYDHYYAELEQEGLAYPCFCSEEDLALMRKIQRASGKPPRYAGTCFRLSPEKSAEKLKQGIKPTLRFHVPVDYVIEFVDSVRGIQKFNSRDIGDFIIRRADGSSPFLFCNAIDDALMGVTNALRGEDHLTNTPRQILILKALGLTIPTYGHISLIIGKDGSPLSKRHGSLSIQELRALGFFPEAINNYMARLGHYYEEDSLMSLEELGDKFHLENLGKAPAKFDYQQLLRWQQEAIISKQNEELWRWMSENTQKIVPAEKKYEFIQAIRSNILFPQDAQKYANLLFAKNFKDLPVHEENKRILQQAGESFFETAVDAVQQKGQDFKEISQLLQQSLQLKGKALFQPLRIAITGEAHGPEMAVLFKLLSTNEIVHRLKIALERSKK